MAPVYATIEKVSDSNSPPFTLPKFHHIVHKSPTLVYATESPLLVPTLKVYHHVRSSPLLVAVWNQTNLGHHLTPSFRRFPSGLFPLNLPAGRSESVHYSCLFHVYMSYLSRSDNRLSVWWKVNIIKIFIVYFSPVFCHFLLGPSILLPPCSHLHSTSFCP